MISGGAGWCGVGWDDLSRKIKSKVMALNHVAKLGFKEQQNLAFGW